MQKFTIRVYKSDKRCSAGERKIYHYERDFADMQAADEFATTLITSPKILVRVDQTMVEVRNIMTNKIVMERFDTPRSCSVGSELHFAM